MDGYRLSMILDGIPPLNSARNLSRWKKNELRQEWLGKMRVAIGNQAPRSILKTARVSVMYFGQNPCDWDNMTHGLKFLLDGLQKFRIIADDGPKCIGITSVKWKKAKRTNARTHVFVRECSSDELDMSAWDFELE